MRYGRHAKHRSLYIWLERIAILILCVLIIWPLIEPYTLDIDQVTLTSSAIPDEVRQLRLVFASDFDLFGFPYMTGSRVDSVISRINALNADLVLLGGDYAKDPEGAIDFFRRLPTMHANYGIYAVMGEHDRTVDGATVRQLKAAMRAKGVTLLENEIATIRIGTHNLYLAGLDDVENGWPNPKGLAASVRQEDYVILMAHNPTVIQEAQAATDANGRRGWFDLGLFGHTHGGQLAVIGSLLGISDVGSRYQRGWITENRVPMLISNGIGTVKLPLRLLRRPQIHLITIRSQ